MPKKYNVYLNLKILYCWGFPGGPVVKTLCFQRTGHGFNPWSGELTSCMPRSAAEAKQNKTLLLKNVNHHLSLQRVIIFFQYQKKVTSLITDHHNKYNYNEKV